MNDKEILKFCIDRGLLLDPELLKLFSETVDEESAKLIIERIKSHTHNRIITRELFEKNKEYVSEFFLELPKENREKLERFKIKLGLQIEISKESSSLIPPEEKGDNKISFVIPPQDTLTGKNPEATGWGMGNVKITSPLLAPAKKVEVGDYIKGFRNRFFELKNILQEHSELENLVSINKLTK